MKLYADPISVNCRKVLAGFDLLGVKAEKVHIDYFKSEQKEKAYTALNPNQSMPTLVDDDLVLWESNAILQYAADKANNAQAYSLDPRKRADLNRWMFWESAHWFPSCYVYLVEHCVKPLFNQPPDAAILSAQDPIFHKLAGILDDRLGRSRWLGGDAPSIADIAVAAPMHLHQYQRLPLAPHRNVVRWMTEGIEKLPCWERTYVGPGFTLERPKA